MYARVVIIDLIQASDTSKENRCNATDKPTCRGTSSYYHKLGCSSCDSDIVKQSYLDYDWQSESYDCDDDSTP